MILDDLKALSQKKLTKTEETALLNKYKIEMIYYLAIENILENYGTTESKEISELHVDALGCARDQMASRLSDAGIVNYDPETAWVKDLDLTDRNAVSNIVINALKNSEALRAVVTTNIASQHVDIEMSDDELFERTDRAFDEDICNINNSGSIVNKICDKIMHTEDIMGENEDYDKYAMRVPVEKILTEDTQIGDKIISAGQKIKTDDTDIMLKISPLMPEIKELRSIDDRLDETLEDNEFLMYDANKKLLIGYMPYGNENQVYNLSDRYSSYSEGRELSKGIVLGESEFTNVTIQGERTIVRASDENDSFVSLKDDNAEKEKYEVKISDNYKYDIESGRVSMFRWRMLHTLEKYSQQALKQEDIDIINEMFDENTFGTEEADIEVNSNAYFDYIEHMCKEVKEKMSSHEFEIHLRHVPHLEKTMRNSTAIMMYMTGERTSDYNAAKSNDSRFFAVYPYMDYIAVQSNVATATSPIMGDIESSAYNKYIVTNKNIRSDVYHVETAENPYMTGGKITAEMVENMRKTFDAYNGNSEYADIMTIRKILRNINGTNVDDLSKFIDRGNIRSDAIINMLIDDMNMTKSEQKYKFATDASAAYFSNSISKFINSTKRSDDDEDYNLATAIYNTFANRDSSIINKQEFKSKLQEKLSRYISSEIRDSYGETIDSYLITKHLADKYLNKYITKTADDIWAAVEKINPNNIFISEGYINIEDVFKNESPVRRQQINDILHDNINNITAKIKDPDDDILKEGLDELFGSSTVTTKTGGVDKRSKQIILKPNMCKYASKTFTRDAYEDLLKLLSYANAVEYEPDVTKNINDMSDHDAKLIIQIYSENAYDLSNTDDNLENTDEDVNAAFDNITWYECMFAKRIDGNPSIDDDADKSYEWLTRYMSDQEEYKHREIYRATHPLQIAAMNKTAEKLREIGDFNAENLKITKQGVIYYQDNSNDIEFKIGPIVDEKAYIRPYTEIINPYDPRYENAPEIEILDTDYNNFVQYDEQGKAKTKIVRAITHDEIVFEGRDLKNPIAFGALDTATLTGNPNMIANRFYGISAQVDNYDGYNHVSQNYIDRMSFSTYKTSILNAIDKDLSLYHIAKSEPDETRRNIALSVLYTNVCASSLAKCYHTNTYILENKAKSEIFDKFMSEYISDPEKAYAVLGDDRDDADIRHALENIVSLTMMQSEMYHDRVIMPKITIDQNIGLYNQVLNLQQCTKNQLLGDVDRKNMRNSDNKGARVAPFADNVMFDPVFSGTAKQLGAVAFFTDAVKFNDLTGKVEIARNASDKSRCTMASTGVRDFATDGIRCRFVNYPGGQAVDRLQLSGNAIEKSLNYVENVKFAMINLGYNMEDGYVVAKRAAHKFGHFGEDGKYHVLEKWDKIGDTESGNKGVVAKIVDTDIGAGLPDAEAEKVFARTVAKDFLNIYSINKAPNEELENTLSQMRDEIDTINRKSMELRHKTFDRIAEYMVNAHVQPFYDEYNEAIRRSKDNRMNNYVFIEKYIQKHGISEEMAEKAEIMLGSEIEYFEDIQITSSKSIAEHVQKLNNARDTYINNIYDKYIDKMTTEKIEPFASKYKHEHTIWKLFRDNPDLDIVITNVCVNTRSNPSLLMYITDGFESEENSRTLKVNNQEYKYAIGTYNIYVDSHTAEDKNRDYTQGSRKSGRKYGSQEMYAIQGKHAVNGPYMQHITTNDITLPDRVAKFNRKMIMNGFIYNPNDNYNAYKLSELFSSDRNNTLIPLSDIISNAKDEKFANMCYVKDDLTGYSFIDMSEIAKSMTSNIKGKMAVSQFKRALKAINDDDLNFGPLLAVMRGESIRDDMTKNAHTAKDEDMLRHIFVTSFARYGGNFMILPENMNDVTAVVTHSISKSKSSDTLESVDIYDNAYANFDYDDFDDFDDYNAGNARVKAVKQADNNNKSIYCDMVNTVFVNDQERKTAPLFLSSREVLNAGTETVTVVSDDKLQFKIFKCALGCAILESFKDMDKIPEDAYNDARNVLKKQFEKCYKDVTNPMNKSLDINNLQQYLKKNIYATVFEKSMTSVWSGDPTLSIDQVGISLEMAKRLDLLKPKKDLDRRDFNKMPDDFEYMSEKYEPIDDNAYITINRSPGQTLGCVRMMKPVIIADTGMGISVHPAIATIFDGDFDGDTIGVINPFVVQTQNLSKDEIKKRRELANDAVRELACTMSMSANLIQTADYTDVSYTDKNGESKTIEFINPLFIAGNADIAIAKYNMMNDVDKNGNFKCGYNTDKELEFITIAANYIETFKQICYDGESGVSNCNIDKESRDNIIDKRIDKFKELQDYLESVNKPEAEKLINDMKNIQDTIVDKPVLERLEEISKLEKENMNRLSKIYIDMTGYMSSPACLTHGESQLDMICNIIRDTNISKKGKEPQLNALLMFSGIHEKCANGCLKVIQEDKKYVVGVVDKATGKTTGILKYDQNNKLTIYDPDTKTAFADSDKRIKELSEHIKLDYKQARSDVPESKHRTQTESNIVAQSDKSDATGLGGAMAQKMQKIFAIRGYGDLGLRISGPITQVYLDAKQNVTKCEKNLKIGKSVLSKVCNFEYVHELSDEYIAKNNAVKSQIYNGQFTFTDAGKNTKTKDKKYLTLDESVSQLSNFLEVMGQPPLSPIDREIVKSCLKPYCEQDKHDVTKQIVKNPLEKCDKTGDITYAGMYAYKNKYVTLINDVFLADTDKGRKNLWHASAAYSNNIDTQRICRDIAVGNMPKNMAKDIYAMFDEKEDSRESTQEMQDDVIIAKSQEVQDDIAITKSQETQDDAVITKNSQTFTDKLYNENNSPNNNANDTDDIDDDFDCDLSDVF